MGCWWGKFRRGQRHWGSFSPVSILLPHRRWVCWPSALPRLQASTEVSILTQRKVTSISQPQVLQWLNRSVTSPALMCRGRKILYSSQNTGSGGAAASACLLVLLFIEWECTCCLSTYIYKSLNAVATVHCGVMSELFTCRVSRELQFLIIHSPDYSLKHAIGFYFEAAIRTKRRAVCDICEKHVRGLQ